MKYRIALLLKEHYRRQVEEWEKGMPEDMRLSFFSYRTLEELKNIFLSVREKFDGFYVSGIIPYQALCTFVPVDMRPLIVYSPIDMENTYRILLQQMIRSKTGNLSRVGMDFLKKEENLEEMILSGRFAQAVHSYEARWESRNSLEEIEGEEEFINRRYLEQCRQGKYDLVITYFHSVTETLQDFDVKCYYVYPSAQAFVQIMENLKKNISLCHLRNNFSAVIHIDIDEMQKRGKEDFGRVQEKVREVVRAFNNRHFNKMILKEYYAALELYTDYDFLGNITEDFTSCPLMPLLRDNADFTGTVGYGVGSNIYQARVNAIDAGRYGRNGEHKGTSFLIDETENLSVLGSGGGGSVLRVSGEYVNEIANQVKLSAETILKIIGVMRTADTDEITSQDLQESLGISLRTANKFLSVLEKYGYAEVNGKKRSGNKGRPVNVYRLKLKY